MGLGERHLRQLIYFVLIIFICTSCSRGGLTSLSLSLGDGRDQSSFADEDTLQKTITVVHIDGRNPVRNEVNYQPGEVPRGQDLSVILSSAPVGVGFFIQFLAVYDNSLTGGVKVAYGHASGVVAKQNEIEITAQNVSVSDKIIRVAGRYLSSPHSGRTGTITARYLSPLGHPAIDFAQFPIQDGWFEISAPDAELGAFSFAVGGEVLFANLAPTDPKLTAFGPRLLQIKKPLSFHLEAGRARPTPEADLYLGFWGQVSNQVLCYIDVQEVIAGEFRDGNLMSPLEYKVTGPTPVQVRPAAGGVAHSYASYSGSNCSLRFDQQRVSATRPLVQ
jgi:hypothetical protein